MRVPETAGINAGSMADIAFLLLIFFLISTTIIDEKGIRVDLPHKSPKPMKEVLASQVLEITIDDLNAIKIEGFVVPVGMVHQRVIDFLQPKLRAVGNDAGLEASIQISISKVSDYAEYVGLFNQLKKAYSLLWNSEAQKIYGRAFDDLSSLEKTQIRDLIPMNVFENVKMGETHDDL